MRQNPSELAHQLLDRCLRGAGWPPELLRSLATDECSDALFRIVVEGLADRFEPALCDAYAALFSEAVAWVTPGVHAGELVARYNRARRPRRLENARQVGRVFVLSRVTLGADVAVSSVMLDAAKRRFPQAEIYLVGGRKNWELFAGDPRIRLLPVAYQRGTLRERLSLWPELRQALSQADGIVIDPDSRLTQLGLLPVCPEENYFFFESRSYGSGSDEPLPALAARWAAETFGVPEAKPYVALLGQAAAPAFGFAISLGVGGNPAKRIPDPFEEELLKHLAQTGATVCIDKGAGGEEAARVEKAMAGAGKAVHAWEGSFAGFAARIARSDRYIGYDSAGQHVAAACGIPLVSVFAGFPCLRMFYRWRPWGRGRIEVIRVDDPDPRLVLERTVGALDRLALR